MKGKLILLLIASQWLAGCTTTNVDQFRMEETISLTGEDSIVILGRREKNRYETEEEFVTCVADVVSSGSDGIPVVPERTFLDGMFPFFEPRTAPMRTDNLQTMLNEEVAARKLEDMGVEYIVWLDGTTETSGQTGAMSCSAGPTGAACFGFTSWVNDSNFEAEIWHIDSLSDMGSISTDANGQSYIPAIIVPIPLIARVQENACTGMGMQIKDFLNGKS